MKTFIAALALAGTLLFASESQAFGHRGNSVTAVAAGNGAAVQVNTSRGGGLLGLGILGRQRTSVTAVAGNGVNAFAFNRGVRFGHNAAFVNHGFGFAGHGFGVNYGRSFGTGFYGASYGFGFPASYANAGYAAYSYAPPPQVTYVIQAPALAPTMKATPTQVEETTTTTVTTRRYMSMTYQQR